eukprot:4255004-Lingulodinium_polyedra.AAC.1
MHENHMRQKPAIADETQSEGTAKEEAEDAAEESGATAMVRKRPATMADSKYSVRLKRGRQLFPVYRIWVQ